MSCNSCSGNGSKIKAQNAERKRQNAKGEKPPIGGLTPHECRQLARKRSKLK